MTLHRNQNSEEPSQPNNQEFQIGASASFSFTGQGSLLDYSLPHTSTSLELYTHFLLEQSPHSGKYQTAVTTLGQYALSGIALNQLFHQTLALVTTTLQLEHGLIWQVLSDGQTVETVAQTGWLANSADPIRINTHQSTWIKQLLEAQQPVTAHCFVQKFIPSNHPDDFLSLLPSGHLNSFHVLIPGQEQPLGILEIYTTSFHQFLTEEIYFLQAIALILATAIERKRFETLLSTQTKILEHVASGKNLTLILEQLCLLLEQQTPGACCSILLLDPITQRLRAGVAPSLPPTYMQAIDGLLIGEGKASCGTSAFRGQAVFVTDTQTDPLWQEFRDFAKTHNIQACWSTPFLSQSGEVLGTFALSHQFPCQPTPYHRQVIQTAIHLASIATEGHQTNEKLRWQAIYDPLTGLPNRAFFMKQLKEKLETARLNWSDEAMRSPTKPAFLNPSFAVMFLDADRFKLVNDSLGHHIGDQLLIEIARLLKRCVRGHDIVARLGGDEFAILLNNIEDISQAELIADRIRAVLSFPLKLEEHEVFASMSIGIVHSLNPYTSPEDLLRDADTAMYHAKTQGQERYAVFDQTMHTNAMIRLHLEGDLRRGIETLCSDEPCQFQLHYQPIISLKNGYLAGFEALLRWAHPERGWVSPLEFIPAAEETGLIAPLGRWVIYEACRQFCQWQQEIGITEDITMSVNVSSRQFLQPDFVWQIQEVLQLTQVDPARIKVEITESGLMETVKTVMVKLEQLKDLGIRLSLDDFGTGYSSLSYLHRFPIDTLKIDGSFVSGLHDGQAQIVQTIITLAHGLEMDAIAEGIETPAQAKLLRAMGCEFGQGYLFSRPVPAKAVEQLFKNPQLFDYSN